MKTGTIALACLILLLCATGGVCQSKRNANEDPNTRSVEGIVTDANDKPVVGAVVQLKDTKTLQIRSFITQDDGAYHFAALSTNSEYQIKADHNGATSPSKTLGVFDSRKTATINLKLK